MASSKADLARLKIIVKIEDNKESWRFVLKLGETTVPAGFVGVVEDFVVED